MAWGHVLLVEDDQDVADFVRDLVEVEGLECRHVRTDAAAYEAIPTYAELDVLIVDVNLGTGTTGFDVARFARRAAPDIAVVYITGQSSSRSFATFAVPGGVLVRKPFTAGELLAPLRLAVSDPGDAPHDDDDSTPSPPTSP